MRVLYSVCRLGGGGSMGDWVYLLFISHGNPQPGPVVNYYLLVLPTMVQWLMWSRKPLGKWFNGSIVDYSLSLSRTTTTRCPPLPFLNTFVFAFLSLWTPRLSWCDLNPGECPYSCSQWQWYAAGRAGKLCRTRNRVEDVLHAAYGRLSLRGAQGAGESPSDRLRGRAKGGRRKGGGLSSCFFYLQVYFPPDFVVLVSRFN